MATTQLETAEITAEGAVREAITRFADSLDRDGMICLCGAVAWGMSGIATTVERMIGALRLSIGHDDPRYNLMGNLMIGCTHYQAGCNYIRRIERNDYRDLAAVELLAMESFHAAIDVVRQ